MSLHTLDHYNPPPDEGLRLLYADEALLLVDKPSGLLSVPGRGEGFADCLIARAQREFPDALIVHRLDMATSGILLLARGAAMQRALSLLFVSRVVHKTYTALVSGRLAGDGRITLPLICDWPNRPRQIVSLQLGKRACTDWQALGYDAANVCSRVALVPHTGRTHQLRVHMQALGHPILGDGLYATPEGLAAAPRLMLHASRLQLPHPLSGELLDIHCPAPF
ncbi:pseudouridine synthase [Vogesella sp. LIG4]|uniref:pseudouridine synthase n=1 Tax=Vogesella sp. LIG4 TaxID=1192162 RepID=UPI00081FFE8A|nr:pseudouridine synthase [Vogesella sp. LIG4]SCK06442.1 tRNA pseudouridine32 synthase / 23S rRNA pseudouridine746 synthase [Vogesella sp. LIG4]